MSKSTLAPQSELLGRTVLGRYRVVKRLARGGMGVVYLARTEGAAGFAKPVVVKRILEDFTGDDNMAQMFIREARILANLEHPGIVTVLDFGHEDNAYMMVLEYVHGYHLGQWLYYCRLARDGLPVDWVVHIVSHVLDALQYAHTFRRPDGRPAPIVHRDISPSNILLGTDGRIKLLDFGIARVLDDGNEYRTQEHRFKGKLAYTAPELFEEAEPDPRNDIYAVGVLLYELLTGANPFRGREMRDTFQRVLNLRPPSVHTVRDDAPEAMDEVLDRALEKSPKERYQTAQEFARDLIALRSAAPETVAADLVKQVHLDFMGEMPAALGLEPLEVRDTAWRELNTESGQQAPELAHPFDDESDTGSLPPDPDEIEMTVEPLDELGPGSAGSPRWKIATGIAAAAAVAALAFILLRSENRPVQPVFVNLSRANSAEETAVSSSPVASTKAEARPNTELTATETRAPEAAERVGTAAAATRKRKPARRRHRPKQAEAAAEALTRAFGKRRRAVENCFSKHAEKLAGRPEIELRFVTDQSGKVKRAALMPPDLSATPLGRCLVGVAKATRFGPRAGGLSFKIPITARVRK